VILYGVSPIQEPDAVGFITHLMDNGCGGMHYIVLGDDGKEQYLFEVFVRARFVDGDCVSRVQNTNVVKGNF
jgi:hypothetical protein